jgi:hypothetical protein
MPARPAPPKPNEEREPSDEAGARSPQRRITDPFAGAAANRGGLEISGTR